MLKVKIVNKSKNPLPSYATLLSAGMDLRANLDKSVTVFPRQRVLIPTGIFIEVPEGYEAQVRPRSGLANKYGLTVLNSPGTVDADFRGEVKVLVYNSSHNPWDIVNGMRIAQMVVAPVEHVLWVPCDELGKSDRNNGDFGSTGIM